VTGVTDSAPSPTPGTLRGAIGLLLAETVAVTLIVGYLLYRDFTSEEVIWRDALIVTGFAAIIAVVLGLLSWALTRRRAWARGPAVVLELMLLAIGGFMISGGLAWLGILVLLLGVLGVGLLVAPGTREALGMK
jgi:hypothetical protein